MAIYRIYPESDAFIFSEQSTGNAGKDEILEIGGYKDISGTGRTSRTLVKFSNTQIQEAINSKVNGASFSSSLMLVLSRGSERKRSWLRSL